MWYHNVSFDEILIMICFVSCDYHIMLCIICCLYSWKCYNLRLWTCGHLLWISPSFPPTCIENHNSYWSPYTISRLSSSSFSRTMPQVMKWSWSTFLTQNSCIRPTRFVLLNSCLDLRWLQNWGIIQQQVYETKVHEWTTCSSLWLLCTLEWIGALLLMPLAVELSLCLHSSWRRTLWLFTESHTSRNVVNCNKLSFNIFFLN